MLTIEYGEQFSEPCTLILGCFDGIHKGHQVLIERAKRTGLPVGLMLLGGKGDRILFTKEERLQIAEDFSIDFCLIVHLESVKNLPAEDFLSTILNTINVRYFVSGEDFRFGAGALGTPLLLASKRETLCCPLLTEDGKKISSTSVREYVELGNVEKANALLSTPFFVLGTVVHGREVGRTYGFPTANVVYPNRKINLGYGVYAVQVGTHRGIANYGSRPTFGEENAVLEVYIDGFEGDLYGKTIRIDFLKKLRDIHKFSSKEELKAQLERDIGAMRSL